jgi:hypothetical protein
MSTTPDTVHKHDMIDLWKQVGDISRELNSIFPDGRWPSLGMTIAFQLTNSRLGTLQSSIENWLELNNAGPDSTIWEQHWADAEVAS